MPKAKVKRKGAVVPLLEEPSVAKKMRSLEEVDCTVTSVPSTSDYLNHETDLNSEGHGLFGLPEEILWMILVKLDLSSVSALERTCRRMQHVFKNAGIWRRIFLQKLETEPGLRIFLPKHLQIDLSSINLNYCSYKELFSDIKMKLRYIWENTQHRPLITRSPHVFGQTVEGRSLYQVIPTGRYLAAFYMTESSRVDIVHVYDRSTEERVLRLDVATKPETFRIVDELKIILVSYPSLLEVQIISIERDEKRSIDLSRSGEVESGSVCDVVVRQNVFLRGVNHRWVVMVALNTEPVSNNQFHIGEIQFFSLTRQGVPNSPPLSKLQFHPVPHAEGFFNQCIQKKGVSDFNEEHAVVVIGGYSGSAVLGVVSLKTNQIVHKLQLKGPDSTDSDGEGEGRTCRFSVVSLMIDKRESSICSVLLSTGQLIVINLDSGKTIFHRHLKFAGCRKLALLQPDFVDNQIIAINSKNFNIDFHTLVIKKRPKDGSVLYDIELNKLRTITNVDADGQENKCEDPTQQLRRQFTELDRNLRSLNDYTSRMQQKLTQGLHPGTVIEDVVAMTRKVQLVSRKLDQAHDKAKELIIVNFAFDYRYCHILTLTRDLVTFDLAGSTEECTWTTSSNDVKEEKDPSTCV